MEKLYYENPYEKEFTANIMDVIEEDDKFHILLDKTYFYPEGGGQPSDTGYIESTFINYVYEKEGSIYHVADRKPSKYKKAKCVIDWERRYDHMQQHLGQHILSACFAKLFNANTIGFHLGEKHSTIDIDKVINDDSFEEAEKMVNEIILNNIPVEVLYPTDQELKKLPLRKELPKTDEQIRLVKLKDIDINACCGTHPYSTIEVQLVKITKWEKYKNGMRIEFLCGKRAIEDYNTKHGMMKEISRLLSVSENDALEEVKRVMKDTREVNSAVKSLKDEVAGYMVEKMISNADTTEAIKIIKEVYSNVDLKYINTIASKLTAYPNVVALFGIKAEDKAHLLFMRSKNLKSINMNLLLKDAITLIDGRGGGSDFSAQGGGKNNNNLESSLDYAYNKVTESILSNKQ